MIDVTLQAVYQYGNLETGGGTSVAFVTEPITGSKGSAEFGPVKYIGSGQFEATLMGVVAGMLGVTAKVGGTKLKAAPATVTVES
jgi:hypothetical protein